MTQINPPYLLPKIRPINEYTKAQNNHWSQVERTLQQIYERLGGSVDSVTGVEDLIVANESQINVVQALVSSLLERIQDLENDVPLPTPVKQYYEVDVTGTHTAADCEEINATQGAVITLPASGEVKVNALDESGVLVNLSGAQTIFGESSVIIESKGSVLFKYLPETDQWVFA